jgi:RHS repeat-associated protein
VQSKRVDMTYDAASQMTGLNRYGDLAGTLSVANSSYTYDAVGRLTNLEYKRGASTLASYGLVYDAANRITQSRGTDGTQNYTYDSTNQLTGAAHTTIANEAYSYDANGNRTNVGYGTSTNNQLLTDGVYNYSYDGEGNRTRRVEIATGKVTSYVWDYRNRLATVLLSDAGGVVTKTIDYSYDVNNRRIGKRIDGAVIERYVYDGSDIALVFDGAGVQTHRYLHGTGIDTVLANERGGAVVWALADNQGTVRDVVDGNGTILNHVTYDSFGRVVAQTNPAVEFRYGYTGREQDGETGLDYYRARYYDAGVGRFIGEDPLGFGGGHGNLTRYVGNSPTNFTDPSGKCLVLPFVPLVITGLDLLVGLGAGLLAGGGALIYNTRGSSGNPNSFSPFTPYAPDPERNRLTLGFPRPSPPERLPGFSLTPPTRENPLGFPRPSDPTWQESLGTHPEFGTSNNTGHGWQDNSGLSPQFMETNAGDRRWENKTKIDGQPYEKPGPKTEPDAPHNKKIQDIIDQYSGDNSIHIGGGSKPEIVIPTPGGSKPYRRADVTFENPETGERIHFNVGLSNQRQDPIIREREALEDIRKNGEQIQFRPYGTTK